MVAQLARLRLPLAYFAAVLAIVASPAVAADWKIETKIFAGDSAEPSAATTTYFHDGVYYDVLGEPAEVTILDPLAGRIALVDMNRRWRTEIKTDDLAGLAERFRAAAGGHADASVRFAANGKFTTVFDERTRELTVAGGPLDYRVACVQPPAADRADECREFSDWCARLNSVHPGRLPARARLAVNEELARRGLAATAVRLTIRNDASAKETTLRSEHVHAWRLSTADLVRVAAVKKLPGECKSVSFAQYLGYDATARDKTASR